MEETFLSAYLTNIDCLLMLHVIANHIEKGKNYGEKQTAIAMMTEVNSACSWAN